MHTTLVTSPPPVRMRPRRLGRVLALAPLAWIVVAVLHPVPEAGSVYSDLRDEVAMWIAVHLLQLVLSLGLAAAVWRAMRGRSGPLATTTRLAIAGYLVFFSAFDAVAGIATGLAAHHASSLTGDARSGAAGVAEYLLSVNHIGGDLSVLSALASISLTTVVVGFALTMRHAGASRRVWVTLLGGVGLNFHAAAPLAVCGALALAYGMLAATRDGLLEDA